MVGDHTEYFNNEVDQPIAIRHDVQLPTTPALTSKHSVHDRQEKMVVLGGGNKDEKVVLWSKWSCSTTEGVECADPKRAVGHKVVPPLSAGLLSLQYLDTTVMKQIQLATSVTQPCIKADGVEVPDDKRYAVNQPVSHLYGGSLSKCLDATAIKQIDNNGQVG